MGLFGRTALRLPFRLAVKVGVGDVELSLVTQDVSFGGMFVRTDVPARQGRLVRVSSDLPFALGAVTLDAMVVHVTPVPSAAPGLGLQLYNCEPGAVGRWNRFVHSVREQDERTSREFIESTGGPAADHVRRKHLRLTAMLDVRLDTEGELVRLQAVDVSLRGLFLRTDLPLVPGDHVFLRLHPPGSAESYGVGAVVRHADDRGVGVELIDWDPDTFETFEQFVDEAIHIREVGVVDIVDRDT